MPVITSQRAGRVVVVSQDAILNIVESRPVVGVVVDQPRVVTTTARGPQGLPGAPGGTSESRVAVGALGGHRLVRSLGAGTVGYVDSANPDHGDDTVGLTLFAAIDGASVDVQRAGPVSFNGWAWTPLGPVFAGRDGLLTQIPPDAASGDAFLQVVGHAEDATTLQLHLEPAFYLE